MDPRPRDDDRKHDGGGTPSLVPDEAPDPVETRDPRVRPVPAARGRAWLYVIPAAVLLVVGLVWMVQMERSEPGYEAPRQVTGTSGERANDPEGGPRGDAPLNPSAGGPAVISDMELLSAKDDYLGRAVEFAAIPVVTVPGPRTLWVGRLMNRTLVLVDRGAAGTVRLAPGTIVSLSGRLEAVPPESELARADLSDDDREALQGEDVFIRASRITPQGDAGANQATVPPGERR